MATTRRQFIKQSAGAVNQSGEFKLNVVPDALAIEARKEGGGRSTVKAFVVVENPNSQSRPQSFKEFRRVKHTSCAGPRSG